MWSANGGVKALFEALDVVYRVAETRSFVRFTATSLAFVLGGIALTIIAIAGVVAVPIALRYIGLPAFGKSLISIARWPILYAVVAAAIAVVYRFGPDRKHPHWRWITWGSALAAFAWIAASVAFSWYTENFGSYNKTYGSKNARSVRSGSSEARTSSYGRMNSRNVESYRALAGRTGAAAYPCGSG